MSRAEGHIEEIAGSLDTIARQLETKDHEDIADIMARIAVALERIADAQQVLAEESSARQQQARQAAAAESEALKRQYLRLKNEYAYAKACFCTLDDDAQQQPADFYNRVRPQLDQLKREVAEAEQDLADFKVQHPEIVAEVEGKS